MLHTCYSAPKGTCCDFSVLHFELVKSLLLYCSVTISFTVFCHFQLLLQLTELTVVPTTKYHKPTSCHMHGTPAVRHGLSKLIQRIGIYASETHGVGPDYQSNNTI